jgi:Transglycosylase SLT domain
VTNTVSDTVSDETLNAIITIESGGNPRAKASTSSALGLFQFLNGTWLAVVQKHRPDLLDIPHERLLSMRCEPKLCIELGARFTEDNLVMLGRNATGGDLYLAHFLGAGDARKLFRSPPDEPVERLVSAAVINANRSIMAGKTCAQVRAWSARRMHESAGHNWISRFYVAPEAEPAPTEEPEPEAVPDTQRPQPAPQPAPAPSPAPAPPPSPVTPREGEGLFDWIKRKGKTIASWFSGGTLGTIGLTQVTDWRIVAVIVGGLVISGTLIGIFYIVSRRSST